MRNRDDVCGGTNNKSTAAVGLDSYALVLLWLVLLLVVVLLLPSIGAVSIRIRFMRQRG